jgi:galactonate dehydratase
VVGEDPHRIEHIFAKMTKFSFWPLGSIGLTAVSAIDQALWDIKAKDLGVPVWQLLGGQVRDRVRVYTHLRRAKIGAQVGTGTSAPSARGRGDGGDGLQRVKLGFVPYCAHEATVPELLHVEKVAAAVRDRVGPDVAIMTDFHGRPASPEVAAPSSRSSRRSGRCSWRSRSSPATPPRWPIWPAGSTARSPPESGSSPCANSPNWPNCGGGHDPARPQPLRRLTGGRKIAAIAEAGHDGRRAAQPDGPVAGAVALHFDVATPNFLIQEEAVGLVPWFDEVFDHPMRLVDGCWRCRGPGFGIEIRREGGRAARHPFARRSSCPRREAVLPLDGTIAHW